MSIGVRSEKRRAVVKMAEGIVDFGPAIKSDTRYANSQTKDRHARHRALA
jgi:hypothetical protein